MKRILFQDSWPESWKISFKYDLMEIYGEKNIDPGYFYSYKNRFYNSISLIKKIVFPGSSILDVAAAQGNFSLVLAEMGYVVTWNDLRSDLVEYVKNKWEYGDIKYLPGNIYDINIDDKYDLVFISEIIEHVAYPDRFLAQISKFLKNGGYVLISTPNGEFFRNKLPKFSDCQDPSKYESLQFQPDGDGHIFLLYQHEIKTLAEKAGFKIIEIKCITNPLTRGHFKFSYFLNYIPEYFVLIIEKITDVLPLFIKRKINITTIALLKKIV